MTRLHVALVAAAVLAMAAPALAHPVPFSYLDLRVEPGAIEVMLAAHVIDIAHDLGVDPPERLLDPAVVAERGGAIAALLRQRLALGADGRPLQGVWSSPQVLLDRQSLTIRIRYQVAATPGILTVTADLFPYDPTHQTFLNVYERGALTSQAILDHHRTRVDYFSGTRQGAFAVARKFVPTGIGHILIGPDHVLFLVGLLLLGGSVRRLLVIVTAFTVAHSVTLSLAVLDLVSPSPRIIEPAIALSIVYVGADNLLARGASDMRAWIALIFGFVHGFGFAYVLRAMDLPSRALGWSLFSFNVGVEIGQLLLVIVVASALGALRARSEAASRLLAVAGSVVVMAAGAFWFIQRAFFG